MKKYLKLLVIASLFLLLMSCGSKKETSDLESEKIVSSEELENRYVKEITSDEFYSGEYPNYTGVVVTYYENGKIQWKLKYKDGLQHGESIGYDNDGVLLVKELYKDDVKHGETLLYYESGDIKLKIPYKNNRLQGEFIGYYENGQMAMRAVYKDGVEHGEKIEYHENGDIKYIEIYKYGKLIKRTEY